MKRFTSSSTSFLFRRSMVYRLHVSIAAENGQRSYMLNASNACNTLVARRELVEVPLPQCYFLKG